MDCGYGSTLLILFEYRMDGRRLTLVCFGQRFMPPTEKKKTGGFMSDNYWPDQIAGGLWGV